MDTLIYISLWYLIGIVSMFILQDMVNNYNDDSTRKDMVVGEQEVWVLGICGLLIPILFLYLYLSFCYDEWKLNR